MGVKPYFFGHAVHLIITVRKKRQIHKSKRKSMYVTVRADVHT